MASFRIGLLVSVISLLLLSSQWSVVVMIKMLRDPGCDITIDIYIPGLLSLPQKAWSNVAEIMRVIAHGVDCWLVFSKLKVFCYRLAVLFYSHICHLQFVTQGSRITASSPNICMSIKVTCISTKIQDGRHLIALSQSISRTKQDIKNWWKICI